MKAAKRPKLVAVPEEMQRISVLLEEELLRWPEVSSRPMFGFKAFYWKDRVFAFLPAKRALEKANAIAYKVPRPEPKREGEKWKFFEMNGESDIPNALSCLGEAYEAARKQRKKK